MTDAELEFESTIEGPGRPQPLARGTCTILPSRGVSRAARFRTAGPWAHGAPAGIYRLALPDGTRVRVTVRRVRLASDAAAVLDLDVWAEPGEMWP